MKIISWNVNGIRSVFKTTFRSWLAAQDADIVCLQETKADYKELADEFSQIEGYYLYSNSSSVRKGHAGVAVYTKAKPLSVETRLGIERFDDEGRCLKLTFEDFILFNFYIPHGGRDKENLPYKLELYEKLLALLAPLAVKPVILGGDFNIAHTELDVYFAKQNQNNIMFTKEEREQITRLLGLGYTDIFRYKYPEKKAYTWWPYANNLRERDIGWRIDYFFVTKQLVPLISDAFTQRESLGSDHGPCGIILNKELQITERATYQKPVSQTRLF